MLKNYLSQSKCVLIIDHQKVERFSHDITTQLSSNSLPPENLLTILKNVSTTIQPTSSIFTSTLQQIPVDIMPTINNQEQPYTILFPIAELSQRYTISSIFQLIYYYQKTKKIHQVFLWASVKNISEEFLIPFLEHMSAAILTIKDSINLSLLIKRSGGSVVKKLFSYKIENNGSSGVNFDITEVKKELTSTNIIGGSIDEPTINPESLATFKINMDDEEMVARNALVLPYERTNDEPTSTGGRIIYNPDSDDDFDEEDPDDDLNI